MAGFTLNKKLTRTFYSDYTHALLLKLSNPHAIKLKHTARGCALLYNKTLEIQVQHFDRGFTEPLSPLDLRAMIPYWQNLPGLGFLERLPATMIHLAIADACRDVIEAFRDKLKFKFPTPLVGEYKHLEFLRGVAFDQVFNKIKLPGWGVSYSYVLVKADPPSRVQITGKVKKVWVIFKDGQWLALVWSRSKTEAGVKAAKPMMRASRRRIGEIQPLVYADNHWIVNAHKKRTGEEE